MKLSEGVEWGVHCVTLLAALPDGVTLSGGSLAEFHGVPPAYLSKTLQALVRAGIISSTPGRHGGYRLARTMYEITMLDMVLAIEGTEPAFRCTEIRRRGPTRVAAGAYSPRCAIASVMMRAEDAWRQELRNTTLADLLGHLGQTVPSAAAGKGLVWLQNKLAGTPWPA
jgi:Rrf2 family protein